MSGLAVIDFTDMVVTYMQDEWKAFHAGDTHDEIPVGWTVDMVSECKHAIKILAEAKRNSCMY